MLASRPPMDGLDGSLVPSRRHRSLPPLVCRHCQPSSMQSVNFHFVNWPEEQWVGGACEMDQLPEVAGALSVLGWQHCRAHRASRCPGWPCCRLRWLLSQRHACLPRLQPWLCTAWPLIGCMAQPADQHLTRACPQTTALPPPAPGRCGASPCTLPLAASTGRAPSTRSSGWATTTVSALFASFE